MDIEPREKLIKQIENGLTILDEVESAGRNIDRNSDSFFSLIKIGEKILDFVENGVDPNTRTEKGFDALFFAIKSTNIDLVVILVAKGAKFDVVYKNYHDYTPLHLAVLSSDRLMTFALLTAIRGENLKIDPEILELKDVFGKTPLHLAALKQNIFAVNALMIEGADPDLVDDKGNKMFDLEKSESAENNLITEIAQKISDYKKNKVEISDYLGAIRRIELAIQLSFLSQKNRSELSSILTDSAYVTLYKILDLIEKDDHKNKSEEYANAAIFSLNMVHNLALDFARSRHFFDQEEIRYLSLEVAQQIFRNVTLVLIENYHVRADITSNLGYTALHFACYFKDQESVEQLILAGSDITKRNKFGIDPYSYIQKRTLVGEGNNINFDLPSIKTDIGLVAEENFEELNKEYRLELLKTHALTIDFQKISHYTKESNFRLLFFQNFKKLNDLISRGADHKLCLEDGIDACYIAVSQKNRKLLYTLIEKKADFSKIYSDKTLLHIFMQNEHLTPNDSDIFIILLHLIRNKNLVIDSQILNKQDENGDTILHLAVKRAVENPEYEVFLRILIPECPNTSLQNKDNKIPEKIPPKIKRASISDIFANYQIRLDDIKIFAFSIINLGRVRASNCDVLFKDEEFYFKKEVLINLMQESNEILKKAVRLQNISKKGKRNSVYDLHHMMNIFISEVELFERSIESREKPSLDYILGISDLIYDYEKLISKISKSADHTPIFVRKSNREEKIFGIKKSLKKEHAIAPANENIIPTQPNSADPENFLANENLAVSETNQQVLERKIKEIESKNNKKFQLNNSDFIEIFHLLNSDSGMGELDFSVCTPSKNDLLMILVKSNQLDLVQKLLPKITQEIAIRNDNDESVITLISEAEKNKKVGMFDVILGSEKLARDLILQDLPKISQLRDPKFATRIFTIENIVKKIAGTSSLSEIEEMKEEDQHKILSDLMKSRSDFVKNLRDKFPTIRSEIAKFENALNQESQRLPRLKVKKEKKETPEEKQARIIAKKIREETEQEKLSQLAEIEQMASSERQTRGFYKAEKKIITNENELMAVADKEAQQFYQQKQQIKQFLAGSRVIKSITDLPQFIQPIFTDLMANGYQILLKGSAIFPQRRELQRLPTDLDIEIRINGVGDLEDRFIQDFFRRVFDIQLDRKSIYRGLNHDNSVFSVNAKDEERRLDISLYDLTKMPPQELNWISNHDRKITFDQTFNSVVLDAFGKPIFDEQEKFNSQAPLILNPKAHDLILRMSFFEIKSGLSRESIKHSISSIDSNPRELILKEFRLDKRNENSIAEQVEKVTKNFVESHNLDEDEKQRFLTNILYFSDSRRPFKKPEDASVFRELTQVLQSLVAPKTESVLPLSAAQITKSFVQEIGNQKFL